MAANVVAREGKGFDAASDRAVVADLVLQISAALEAAVRQRDIHIVSGGPKGEG